MIVITKYLSEIKCNCVVFNETDVTLYLWDSDEKETLQLSEIAYIKIS